MARATPRSRWKRRLRSSAAGGNAFSRSGWPASRIVSARAARAAFPPEEIAQVKAIACQLPREHDLPLSRFSRADLPGGARYWPPRRQAPARLRPLRAQRRDRPVRPARLAGDDQAALLLRPPRLLDRRQRLFPPRPESDRAAPAALAEPRPRPPA